MGHLESNGQLSPETYSVPYQSRRLFDDGILQNPLVSNDLPHEALEYGAKVKYVGSNAPSIPINWRFAESTSALKGLEATMINVLLARKYGVEPQEVTIHTDHAQLFFMSTLLWTIDPDGKKLSASDAGCFPSWDLHRQAATFHRDSCTNIYKTKDDRYFHLHGSMNPDPSLDSIGLTHELDASSKEESWEPFKEKMAQIDSQEMQHLASDVHRQAGTICWTKEEFAASEHVRANAHIGLWDLHSHPNPGQKPGWWLDSSITGVKRPLAGLKVLDITRVIAAPSITRSLAEMGASVMRVTAPHLVDFSRLHCDLNWGKWNSCLDLRKPEDREKMRQLVLDADVVVEGYRPGLLDKWGLGKENVVKICEGRDRGVIYCCGVSMEFGRAMGNDEAVTPVFPNSDYCTGVTGAAGILAAILQRAEKGGSYSVDVALNYYSQWLVHSCGTYPQAVWEDVWSRNGRQVFRHYHNMGYLLPRYMGMLHATSSKTVLSPEFFEIRECKVIGKQIRTVKPVVQFPEGKVELGYNVGTRTNGIDQPRWPRDLMVEIVGEKG